MDVVQKQHRMRLLEQRRLTDSQKSKYVPNLQTIHFNPLIDKVTFEQPQQANQKIFDNYRHK